MLYAEVMIEYSQYREMNQEFKIYRMWVYILNNFNEYVSVYSTSIKPNLSFIVVIFAPPVSSSIIYAQ